MLYQIVLALALLALGASPLILTYVFCRCFNGFEFANVERARLERKRAKIDARLAALANSFAD